MRCSIPQYRRLGWQAAYGVVISQVVLTVTR